MQNNATTADDIIREIKHILVEEMQLNVTAAEIPDDYSLLESGLALDSILISELIARIEDRFGLQFDDRLGAGARCCLVGRDDHAPHRREIEQRL